MNVIRLCSQKMLGVQRTSEDINAHARVLYVRYAVFRLH